MLRLKGLIAAPFTPLEKNGDIALDKIVDLVRLYEKNKVNGAFVCGTTGEGVSLTFEEKKQVMKRWGEVKGADVKALFMLGGTCQREMIELAQHSAKNSMDGISILCPFYFRPGSEEELVSYCKTIAEEVPELPFYYYHIPGLTGGDFNMLKFLELADEEIPSLAGIKYTGWNVMDFHGCRNFKEGKYNILWGVDEALLSGLSIGAEGAVGSTYNYAAPLYNGVIDAFQRRDMVEAEELQAKAVKMVELLIKYGGTGAGKAFMKLIGVDCGWFRAPVSRPTAEDVKNLEKDLQAIGFFDFCSKT